MNGCINRKYIETNVGWHIKEGLIMDTITKYKGYDIEYDVYKQGEYSVFFAGDDVMFSTLQDAMNFIDEQIENRRVV